jgi:hypothetical protein
VLLAAVVEEKVCKSYSFIPFTPYLGGAGGHGAAEGQQEDTGKTKAVLQAKLTKLAMHIGYAGKCVR